MLRHAFTLVAGLAALGCTPSYDLGVTPPGTGGASASSSTTAAGTGGAASSTSGTGGVAEPSGPTALTIVNGINDYAAARFCFLPGDTPWPAAAGGLPFATGQAVDLATALPAGTDVTVWAIAGDLAATAGMTCTQILALAQPADGGAPPVVAAAVALLTTSLLASDKSLLLATTGCMGGAGHDDPSAATNGCGAGYTSQTPTVGVVPAVMSRLTDPKHVSLQVVSASALLPTSDVRVLPGMPQPMEVSVAPSLAPGAIGPYPPFDGLTLAAYGVLSAVQIKTYLTNSQTIASTTLGPVLTASTVGTAGFADGAGLVLVAVGGAPGVAAGAFWNAFTFVLVKASP